MAGHSQFKNIMYRKGAQDKKRAKIFTKLIRELQTAARTGLPDPAANPRLRAAVLAARVANMPKDTVERAIKRGAGGDDAEKFEHVTYEGYGPGGVAVIVEALTDNRNRTASDVRHLFSKHDGNLGGSGAVAWLFERRGVAIVRADGASEDDVMLAAADGGADDVALDGDVFQVTGSPETLSSVREALEGAGLPVESVEVTMVPKTTVRVEEEGVA